jgi:thiamine pyrophosphokinase
VTVGAVLVVAGGEAPTGQELLEAPPFERVIAADSGLDHALALGLHVDLVVGDLDSVSAEALAGARSAGAAIDEHPADKDQTDLELALDAAVGMGANGIVVIGAHGGRADHALANLSLLAAPAYADLDVEARADAERVVVVRSKPRSIHGRVGEPVSLVPVHGPAVGVRTEGLRWPLDGDTLGPGSTRGVSNEFVTEWGWVVVADGVLLVVQPGPAVVAAPLAAQE